MDDDFDYEKEYKLIISDIDRIDEILENQRKEKQTLKYNKIYNYTMSFLWIFSMVIAYIYIIILKRYYSFEVYPEPPYFTGPPIGNSSLFETYKKYFQPYFGILQYAVFSIKRIIPSKVISVILSSCVGFILILPAKIVLTNWLQHFYDVPSLYWLFIIYCISILLYFSFGIFTIFNKKMYSYMENVSFINWLLPCLSNQLDNKGNRKITNTTYVIVLVPFLVLFLLSNFL
ncbi:hypothetical protein [Clostridium paridis]|uniref:Uncharacterized protein n=1 Tax=Clostridium paridis TaxID=2803863 RepID=A0A937K3S7_9CLOT|nr:hypothetical protein [Clostridium paridis]MBL4930405.1 hypothetical protein [Clostridium paridis]